VAFAVQHVEPYVVADVREMLLRQRVVFFSELAANVPHALGYCIEYDSAAVFRVALDLSSVVEAGAAQVLSSLPYMLV
jgi:hypothetical protein